jgi:hypothetical protein
VFLDSVLEEKSDVSESMEITSGYMAVKACCEEKEH